MRDIFFVIFFIIIICNLNFSSTIHIVKSGETLWSLSKKYNIPVNCLIKLNNITNNIKIGEKIIIPEKMVYVVQKGDTLTSISKKFNVSYELIMIFNNLDNYNLFVNQKLVIPIIKSISSNYNNNNYNKIDNESRFTYIVQKGDTLTSLSKKFNTTIEEIIRINNKTTCDINIGEKLVFIKNENKINNTKNNEISDYEFPIPLNLIKYIKETDRGIVISLEKSYNIRAIFNGIVEYTDNIKFYKGVVIIKGLNDLRIVYGGLKEIYVENNKYVKKGNIIGKIDINNDLNNKELYLEIRKGKKNVNILNLFPELREKIYIVKR